MVSAITKQLSTVSGLATTSSYVGTATNDLKTYDAAGIIIIHEAVGANDIKYKVQVAATVATPTESDWGDFVAETSLATATSVALQYTDMPWRWIRVALLEVTATEDVTVTVSGRKFRPS